MGDWKGSRLCLRTLECAQHLHAFRSQRVILSWASQEERRYSPVGEKSPDKGSCQVPSHEDGLAQGLQALGAAHQVPLEEREA